MRNDTRAADVFATSTTVCMVLDRESFDSILGPLKGILDRNLSQVGG